MWNIDVSTEYSTLMRLLVLWYFDFRFAVCYSTPTLVSTDPAPADLLFHRICRPHYHVRNISSHHAMTEMLDSRIHLLHLAEGIEGGQLWPRQAGDHLNTVSLSFWPAGRPRESSRPSFVVHAIRRSVRQDKSTDALYLTSPPRQGDLGSLLVRHLMAAFTRGCPLLP